MATASKLFIGIDNDKIELTGSDKEAFIEQLKADNAEHLIL